MNTFVFTTIVIPSYLDPSLMPALADCCASCRHFLGAVDGAKIRFLNSNSFKNVFDVICAEVKCEHVIVVTFKQRKRVEKKREMIDKTETPFYIHSASHV